MFEQQKKYLQTKRVSLHSVDLKIYKQTPITSLGLLILIETKNFSQYLNDLRIAYALEALQENPTFFKILYQSNRIGSAVIQMQRPFQELFTNKQDCIRPFISKQLSKKKK